MEDIISAIIILGEIVIGLFFILTTCVMSFIFIMNYKDKHTLKDLHYSIKEKFPTYVQLKLYFDGSGDITDYESNILYGFNSIKELRKHLRS